MGKSQDSTVGHVVAIMGPPNAGKGSQGTLLARRMGAAHLSTGELLRSENDPRLIEIMTQGGLVPSADFERILSAAIARVPHDQPIVLDGIAKKPGEAEWIFNELPKLGRKLEKVVLLWIDKEVSHERSLARGRHDDSADVQDERWARYYEETMRSIEFFRGHGLIAEVDGIGTEEEVADRIKAALHQ